MATALQLTERFWQLFEQGNLDAIAPLIDADCHFKMPGMEMRGYAAIRQMLEAYRTGFPDLRHHIKHHVESADTIAIELDAIGTHTGPMQTAQGVVPATGKRVVFESCDYIRFRGDKIVSWHVYHDPNGFLSALGLAPPAA